MEELQGQVFSLVVSLVGSVLAWAALSARNYLKQKVQNEYASGLLIRLTDAVEVGVRDTASTLVPQIRKAAADSKISAEEAEQLRQAARAAVFDQLTKVDVQKLGEFFEGRQLRRKLDQLIEASVQRLKEGK